MSYYELNRTCEYNGETYKVLSVLDNNLLLVLSLKDLESGKFPLQPLIIPSDESK